MNTSRRTSLITLVAAMMVSVALYSANASAAITKAPPGGHFKPVSKLVALPDFLPGLGTLYVDPATLPVGPYLGYDHKGKLVNIVYMVSMKDMSEHKDFKDLGAAAKGMKVDHTSVLFNPGHAGLAEPHYHIIQWLIPASKEQELAQ